jgi:hypothetical protein
MPFMKMGTRMTLLKNMKEYHSRFRDLFPPSRRYTGRQLEQVRARLDQLEGFLGEIRSSPESQSEVLSVLRLLKPTKAVDRVKIRVGTKNDGGYILLDDLHGISRALSFGIGGNDDWDVAMAKAGIPVEQFDHTIALAPSTHPFLNFHRKMISSEAGPQSATLPHLVAEYSRLAAPDLILKIDIEGSEWDVFDHAEEAVVAKFAQVVGEFHQLSHLASPTFRGRARRVFEKIGRHFSPIHIHGTNSGAIANVCNIAIPDALEITFASRARYSFVESDETFPTPLDAPSDPKRPDIVLGAFRF